VVQNMFAFHDTFGTRPGDALWLPPEDRVNIW
jgi:putative endopeptidase